MKILGIDHGTNYAGWAVLDDGKLLRFGLRDYTEVATPTVFDCIYRDARRDIRLFWPDVVVVEKPVHFRNANSVRALVGAYTAVLMAALHEKRTIVEVAPNELKKMTGKGNADKWMVAVEMQFVFDLDFDEIAIPVLYQRDDPKGKYKKGDIKERLFDPADAIALCWTYYQKYVKGVA